MGQATIDLPDPTQLPPDGAAPAAANSADDLLSQLAGDEIDRLLAEADVDTAPPSSADEPATETPSAEAPAVQMAAVQAPAAKAPAVQAPAASAPAIKAPAAEAPAAQSRTVETTKVEAPTATPPDAGPANQEAIVEQETAAAIDELLNAAMSEKPPAAPEPAAAPIAPTEVTSVVMELPASVALTNPTAAAKELDEALAKGSAAALPEVKFEAETSPQEKSALADVVQAMDEIDAAPQVTLDGAPWYLKPLIWLNAPFAVLPEPVREALGKIGILTFVNAIAVFAYLLIFRRHHH